MNTIANKHKPPTNKYEKSSWRPLLIVFSSMEALDYKLLTSIILKKNKLRPTYETFKTGRKNLMANMHSKSFLL